MNPSEEKKAARAFVERWQAAEGNEQRRPFNLYTQKIMEAEKR